MVLALKVAWVTRGGDGMGRVVVVVVVSLTEVGRDDAGGER